MAKNKGNRNMGVQQPRNEFAPTLINDGGEDGARFVDPAKLAPLEHPAPPAYDEKAEAEVRAASEEKRERYAAREREFVDYVNGELKELADDLGYELRLAKRGQPTAGPVMLYDPATREGRVFSSSAEAPAYFLSGDQLNAIREQERADGLVAE